MPFLTRRSTQSSILCPRCKTAHGPDECPEPRVLSTRRHFFFGLLGSAALAAAPWPFGSLQKTFTVYGANLNAHFDRDYSRWGLWVDLGPHELPIPVSVSLADGGEVSAIIPPHPARMKHLIAIPGPSGPRQFRIGGSEPQPNHSRSSGGNLFWKSNIVVAKQG